MSIMVDATLFVAIAIGCVIALLLLTVMFVYCLKRHHDKQHNREMQDRRAREERHRRHLMRAHIVQPPPYDSRRHNVLTMVQNPNPFTPPPEYKEMATPLPPRTGQDGVIIGIGGMTVSPTPPYGTHQPQNVTRNIAPAPTSYSNNTINNNNNHNTPSHTSSNINNINYDQVHQQQRNHRSNRHHIISNNNNNSHQQEHTNNAVLTRSNNHYNRTHHSPTVTSTADVHTRSSGHIQSRHNINNTHGRQNTHLQSMAPAADHPPSYSSLQSQRPPTVQNYRNNNNNNNNFSIPEDSMNSSTQSSEINFNSINSSLVESRRAASRNDEISASANRTRIGQNTIHRTGRLPEIEDLSLI